ncbi:MAG TPA: hypothetical protein VKE23_04420 [Candidatus Limnocylindria bacterium]|nr:hypothetical protein [Candidatus Limnocylindria bacterium]
MKGRGGRSPLSTELIGWAATLAFVAVSYALRRWLNRPGEAA